MKRSLLLALYLLSAPLLRAQQKEIAVTVDDLPVLSKFYTTNEQKMQVTQKILAALKQHHAPAIGFVNEGKMYAGGEENPEALKLLDAWMMAGMTLGNHTMHHMDYNKHSLKEFGEDIMKGEKITRSLMDRYGQHEKYFRHPFLHRGNSKEKVDSLMVFLKQHNYTEAPVTIDNSDWIFSEAYDSLLKTGDSAKLNWLGQEYVKYMEAKLKFYEHQCDTIFHTSMKHTLLIHANAINADWLDALLAMYEKNGYRFITLDEALTDKMYKTKDKCYKGYGISWIHRWALTKKVDKAIFKGEPAVPQPIMAIARETSE